MNNVLSSHPWLALLNTEELLNISKKTEEYEIDDQKFVKWFSNFKNPTEYTLALKIFEIMDFRTNKRLIDTIENYKTIIEQSLYELEKSNIVLVSSDDNTDSSNRFIYDLAKKWEIHDSNVFKASELTGDTQKNPNNFFVFFNDTHGTGNQFVGEFKSFIDLIGEQNCAIICITITDIALERFIKEFPNIAFIQPNFQSTKCIKKHQSEQKLTQEDLKLIEELGVKVYPSHPLGYKDSSLLIAYSHQCPNNTLPIIWANGDNNGVDGKGYPWKPLFEYKKIKKKNDNKSDKIEERNLTIIPPKNPDFIGRVEELKEIKKNLESDKLIYIVNGIGGVGKSELSYEYFHNHKDEYKKVAFIELSSEELSLEDVFLIKFKEKFQLNNFDEIIRRLQEYPERNLLLIDNLERVEDFKKLKVLNSNFDLLITTRQTDIDINHQLNLETLIRDDARELFLSIYKTDEVIEDILDYLDNHPLFINLTAKSLKRNYITLSELRDDIKNNTISKIQSKDKKTFEEHLKNIFNKQFSTEKDENLKVLLQKLAIFPSVEISFDVHEKLLNVEKLQLQTLVDKGWLSHNDGQYKLHQIIKTFILTSYSPKYDVLISIFENVSNYIDPDDSTLVVNILTHYIPIVESFLSLYEDKKDRYIAGLLDSLTCLNYSLADYDKALSIQNESTIMKENLKETDAAYIAKSYNLLGVIYESKAKYDEALRWHEKSLKIKEKVLGINNSNTAITYNNIASAYNAKGKYDEALEWYEKALKIQEKVLGTNHTSTASTYSNIAELYKSKGKYDEAIEWYEKALKIQEKVLVTNHPDTSLTYSGIAAVYNVKGKYDESLEWYEKALKIQEKVLGTNHPITATTYNDIAFLYQTKSKYDEALEWYVKALDVYIKVLGSNHHFTAIAYSNIAYVYKSLKFCTKANAFLDKALNIFKQTNYYQYDIFKITREKKEIKKLQKKQKTAKFKDKGRYCKD